MNYAPWVDICCGRTTPVDIGTKHLPAEVVGNEFLLAVDARTDGSAPRDKGGAWVSLNFGGRLNPEDLTDDEREYILAVVQFALGGVP
jgi:hypothetical protein